MQKLSHLYIVVFANFLVVILGFLTIEFAVRHYAQHNRTFEERATYNVSFEPSAYSKFNYRANQKVCAYINGQIKLDSVKYRINSNGYRGSEFSLQKDSGEIRIVILGGSHVFDPNCFDYEGCPGFPEMMQKDLRKRGFNVTVINAGFAGSTTKEQLMRAYFDISRYNPDYVVINSIWNDMKWITSYNKETKFITEAPMAVEKNPLVERMNVLDNTLGWSAVYRKIRDYYWLKKLNMSYDNTKMLEVIMNNQNNKKAKLEVVDFKEGCNQYRNNLILLINIIRQFNAVPVLAVEESLISDENTNQEKKKIRYDYMNVKNNKELVLLYTNCSEIIIELAKKNNLELINIGQEIKSLKYFSDHVHMTQEGSKKIAKFYADFFEKIIKDRSQLSLSGK